MDFQKLIVLEPKNPMVHIYAGNLLMTTGSYEDATKAFTNADNIHKSPLALYQRSRCQVALNNMTDALRDLNKVIEISPNDKVAISDKECLTALNKASTGLLQNAAVPDKSIFEKSIVLLTKLISYEKNEHLAKINHDSSILHYHS
jgi:tetratricopeptide (TPR) repeat protein